MNAQKKTINGDIYRVLDTASEDYKRGRLNEVGDMVYFEDGRVFRFVSSDASVSAGNLVQARAASAELVGNMDAASANSRVVSITVAGVVANRFAGGYLTITQGTVQTTYVIRKNTATDGAGKVLFTLKDPLQEAVTATDDCILKPNRHSLVTGATAATQDVVGVAISTSTAAATGRTNYFWVQVKGPGSVRVTTAAGLTTGLSFVGSTAGGVAVASAVTQRVLGYNTAAGIVSDGDVTSALLCIE